MTIYEKESVESKLFRLKEIIKVLEELSTSSREEFVADYKLNNVGMFNLMIGVTIILDIGQYLLTRYSQRTAKEYKEVVQFLGEENIIPPKFASENTEMAKFRNLLVHDYDKIDEALVYDYLQKAPDIFRSFAKAYVDFMERRK